jgi:hypothetical protein
MATPLILEALEEIGPCNAETLSSHINQSEGVINSMLVNYMRKGYVRCVNPDAAQFIPRAYELTEKARAEYGLGECDENGATRQDEHSLNRVCKPEPAPHKASAPVVQPEISHKAEVKTASPATSSQNNTDKVSKAESLRQLLQQSGEEMSSAELAKQGGFPVNYIGGLLKGDVQSGRIGMRKEGHRAMYRWEGEPARQKKTSPAPTKNEAFNGEESHLLTGDVITVPTSSVLAAEVSKLDDQLVRIKKMLDDITAERTRKGALLLVVQQLESHLREGAQ